MIKKFFASVFLCFFAVAAHPQHVPDHYKQLFDYRFPSWQTVADPRVENRIDKVVNENNGRKTTIFELMPKGQSDRNWRKRHWVAISEQVKNSPKRVMMNTLTRMSEECAGTKNYAVFKETRKVVHIAFHCSKLKNENLGLIGTMWWGKNGNDLFRVSEEWRGKPFDWEDKSTYFWKQTDFNRAVSLVGQSRVK
ncbi:MAG: hypothetical protein GY947_11735 [Rhodobacteraceae bacterium]|nr:hypothetical protein [Paracoccaceae bacterium]